MVLHGFLGLSWSEIAAIIAIVAGIYGGLHGLLKSYRATIMEPLGRQMTDLSDAIKALTQSSVRQHEVFDKRLDTHDIRLGQHDVEIGTLFHATGIHRKENGNEKD